MRSAVPFQFTSFFYGRQRRKLHHNELQAQYRQVRRPHVWLSTVCSHSPSTARAPCQRQPLFLGFPSYPAPHIPAPQSFRPHKAPRAVESTFALLSVFYRQQMGAQWNITCSRSPRQPVTRLGAEPQLPKSLVELGGRSWPQRVTCSPGRPNVTSPPVTGNTVLHSAPSSATLCRSPHPPSPVPAHPSTSQYAAAPP